MRPTEHYCIPPLSRMNQGELLTLIGNKRYFVLHAPGYLILGSLLQKLWSVDEELGRENKRTNLSRLYFVEYAVRTSVAPHSTRIRSLMRRR